MARKLKRPAKKADASDEFVSILDRARDVFLENWRVLAPALVVAVVIIIGVLLWTRNLQRKETQASILLSQGITALKNADGSSGGEASSSYDEALGILTTLVEEYGSTESGELGLLLAGKCLSRLKRYGEAVKQYEEFLDVSKNKQLYRSLALQGLGFAYENEEDYDKAVACFSELAEMDGSFLRGESILALARIHEQRGQREKALQAYRDFLASYPDSTESHRIQRRVALLEKHSR